MSAKLQMFRVNPTIEYTVTLQVRNKNRAIARLLGGNNTRPEVLELLTQTMKLETGETVSRSDLPPILRKNIGLLRELGFLVEVDRPAPGRVVPDLPLVEAMLPYVPPRARALFHQRYEAHDLQINPGVLIQEGQSRPEPLKNLIGAADFPAGPNLAWVFDPGTRIWSAYRLGSGLKRVVRSLLAGRINARALEPVAAELLAHANILVPSGYIRERERFWAEEVGTAAENFRKNGHYTVVRGVIPAMSVACLRAYFKALESEGYLYMDVEHVRNMRLKIHGDTLATFIHLQSMALARKVIGEEILASYSYLSAYAEGAYLPRHKDRVQCRWNGGILVESEHGMDISQSWPFHLRVLGKTRTIQMDYGDFTFYSGTEQEHWRRRLKPGQRQTILLLHYVPLGFLGSFD